jgi:hypothetical protein
VKNRRRFERWNNRAVASSLAAKKRHAHFALRDKEARMTPKKPKFIGEIPVRNRIEGSPAEGELIGSAQVEELSGRVIVHVDGSTMTGEMLRRGFSLGSFSIVEDSDGTTKLES